MTTLYNVTEARGKLTQIGEQIKPGTSASFLKNGKILFVGIAKKDFEEYQKYKEEIKRRKWESSLPTMEISDDDAKSIAESREEMKKEEKKSMTVKEVMNLI